MLRSYSLLAIWVGIGVVGVRIGDGEGELMREEGKGGGRGGQTESVHLNWPRNIRVSVVVMRRVLFSREAR